jgi:hypothetical protein
MVANEEDRVEAGPTKFSAAERDMAAGQRRKQQNRSVDIMSRESVRDRSGKPAAKRGLGTQSPTRRGTPKEKSSICCRSMMNTTIPPVYSAIFTTRVRRAILTIRMMATATYQKTTIRH